jgi:uncharacterized protein (DUF2249 family)
MASQAAGSNPGLLPTRGTKISELLRAYPDMIEVLARFNSHFELLRRPALRKLMAPLVTIEKAARTANVDPGEMLAAIYHSIGRAVPSDQVEPRAVPETADQEFADRPCPIPDDRCLVLDVREQVRAGEEPYHRIMRAVAALEDDQALRLCTIFEPVPLYDVLDRRGFAHWIERRGPEEWWITFYRSAAPAEKDKASAALDPARRVVAADPLVVDARGLEPPQPMAKILEALPRIEAGGEIRALTDRRPMLLYAKLEDRRFKYATEEVKSGWFETRIWK